MLSAFCTGKRCPELLHHQGTPYADDPNNFIVRCQAVYALFQQLTAEAHANNRAGPHLLDFGTAPCLISLDMQRQLILHAGVWGSKHCFRKKGNLYYKQVVEIIYRILACSVLVIMASRCHKHQ
jgi:hypothetical protein